jgi:hypothetical protein
MAEPLAGFLLSSEVDVARILGAITICGYLSAWNPTTGENTVTITGTQTFTNLAILCDPALLSMSIRVQLLRTPGAPVILGRLRVPPF